MNANWDDDGGFDLSRGPALRVRRKRRPRSRPPGGSATGWKIATGVATLLAVGALAWGLVQQGDAEVAEAAQTATAEQAQAAIAEEEQRDADLAAELEVARAEHAKIVARLKTKADKLKSEASELDDLQQKYKRAQADAAAEEATVEQELLLPRRGPPWRPSALGCWRRVCT